MYIKFAEYLANREVESGKLRLVYMLWILTPQTFSKAIIYVVSLAWHLDIDYPLRYPFGVK